MRFDPTKPTAKIIRFAGEREIAQVLAESDPFLVDNTCDNPAGHNPIRDGGRIVCEHCGRIFFQ